MDEKAWEGIIISPDKELGENEWFKCKSLDLKDKCELIVGGQDEAKKLLKTGKYILEEDLYNVKEKF